MGGRGATYRNCKTMAINAIIEQMCDKEGDGSIDLWGYFVGKEDMYMRDGLHICGKGAAVFSENLL
jgi:lysophospholipase L1-like esterase